MNKLKATLAAVAAILALGLVATAPAQATNLANLTFFSSGFPSVSGNCSFTFARSAWSGGGPQTSTFDSFSPVSGYCASPFTGSVAMSKDPLASGVGAYDATGTITITAGMVNCTYGFDLDSTWLEQPGTPDREDFHVPLTTATFQSGSFLCPNPSSFQMMGWMAAEV